MIRGAIVGVGAFASARHSYPFGVGALSHVDGYSSSIHAKLVAICDSNEDALLNFPGSAELQRYPTVDTLLASAKPEMVSICTSDNAHVPVLLKCLAAGVRHVVVEKPLAPTLEQAKLAIEAVDRSDTTVAVNFTRRFPPKMRSLLGWLAAGGIGNLQVIRGSYTRGFVRNASHWVDLLQWVAGQVSKVRVNGGTNRGDNWDADFETVSGARASIVSLDADAFDHFEFDAIGTKGRVRFLQGARTVEIYNVVNSLRFQGIREEILVETRHDLLEDAARYAFDSVIEAARERKPPACTLIDGARVTAVLEAAKMSAVTLEWESVAQI
jgi:predicted dehydrogenase